MFRSALVLSLLAATVSAASAQTLGTFRWQLQPFCNVVTVTVTGIAGVYTLDGFDDQCGTPTRAPLTGVATPNPDGSLGFGLNVVTTPGGRGLQIEARISLATLGGSWSDSDGRTGTFAFNQATGGSARPVTRRLGVAAVDTSQIQRRITGTCPGGGVVAGVREDGTTACKPGFDATTTGAADLSASTGFVMNQLSALNPGIPREGVGRRLMWYPGKAAFRVGEVSGAAWDDVNVGHYSVAMGLDPRARGDHSLAVGHDALAEAQDSVAIGRSTYAGAHQAVAIGNFVQATGAASVVLGTNAMTTAAAVGSFVFGDASTQNTIQSFFPNEFRVRAAGGTFFYSNPTLSSGVRLAAGASAWSSLSDVNSKEHFRDLDGGDVLAKIARMPIREWNYKAQDAAIRHVGPTAQDFHAAFGLGEDPLRISTIDADGIALAAIQALEARTRADRDALVQENGDLRAALAALQARLDALEHRQQ